MATRILYNEEFRLVPWAEKRIGSHFRDDAKTIGMERDGRVVAVVAYDTFSTTGCNMHIASDGSKMWLNRAFLVCAFAYPFTQCGFTRVTGLVSAKNSDALRFDEHLGFVREGVLRRAAADGSDVIVLGMLRDECKYIAGALP